jgi:hypothetical protein
MVRELINRLSSRRISWIGACLARVFWAIMLVGHFPALIVSQGRLYEAAPEPIGILKFAFLILSVVYFCLKLIGFRFWRIDPSWDRVVVYCLVVLLLHSGVVVDLNVPLGQTGLGWVHLISPFIVALGGAALAIAIRQCALQAGGLVPVPISKPRFSHDALIPPPAPQRRELFASSIQRRGPPDSLYR